MRCDEKEWARSKPFEPESPYVVVCEGFHDMALVCELLRHQEIKNCDVTYPTKQDGANGKTGIKSVVKLLAERDDVKGILIVTDADDEPENSFRDIAKAFIGQFKPPSSSFTIQEAKERRTGVFLTPGRGKTGALEQLLLEAATEKAPEAIQCIDAFQRCTDTTADWSANKIAKMRLACYIASHCKNDPCCSPAFIWAAKNRLLDISSPVFDELANFLKEFSADGSLNSQATR